MTQSVCVCGGGGGVGGGKWRGPDPPSPQALFKYSKNVFRNYSPPHALTSNIWAPKPSQLFSVPLSLSVSNPTRNSRI